MVELTLSGEIDRNHLEDKQIRDRAADLYPAEPLYRIADRDWPGAFLVADAAVEPVDPALRWLGDWVVALTIAIQRWGRDPVWRGRVCVAEPGRLRLAIPWYRTEFFDQALALALRLLHEWLRPADAQDALPWRRWLMTGTSPAPTLDQLLDDWPAIQAGGLGPNSLRFVEAAVHRGMPFDVLPSFVQIGWGANASRFDLAVTQGTSWIAMGIARDKVKAIRTLADAGLPVPVSVVVGDGEHARNAADRLGWPVVVKPVDQDGGVGVTPGISDATRLVEAFERAREFSPDGVLVEQHIPGDDHRILVARGQVLQVVRRTPASVIGDGLHTVDQLVGRLNADPRRGRQRYSLLKRVEIGAEAIECLAEQQLHPGSVPAIGQVAWLSRTANISSGGTAEDVTDIAHPDNVALAARAARIIGLDIAGVDFLCPDISRSWRDVGGAICEVNGQPGFRPHWLADPERDINGEILDILFSGRPARVPTVAITGTNGKTTTSEMLHRIWTAAGMVTGVCTTARVRIGMETVSTENLSGQPGARIILNDPGVQVAVIEMPRKGMILFGHHCDRYDVAALLNVQDDHLGVDGIDTLEQMAGLKAEVLERATQAVVVNADDPLCLAMRERAVAPRHILVSRGPDAEAVVAHRGQGGEAVFLADRSDQNWIILAAGDSETDLMPVEEIPAALNGRLPYTENNALFAAAVAWAQGVDVGTIRRALGTFENSVEQNPGRYNSIGDLPFDVLVDFAHNPDGVRGVCDIAAALPVAGRRLLCSLNIGNRHPQHLQACAPMVAATFDDFVLGSDPKLVGGCVEYAGADPTAAMLSHSRNLLVAAGVDPVRITCEPDRHHAIRRALERARPGDLVVLLADLDEARAVVDRWRSSAPENFEIRNG